MSAAPLSDPIRRRSRRRRKLLGLVLGLLAALTGCGEEFDPLRTYEDGATVQVTGVVHFPATTQGDFLPGRLIGHLNIPLTELGVENLRDSVLPGSNVIFNSETPNLVRFDLPAGMSLAEGAARLQPTGMFSSAAPEYLEVGSSAATLRTSSPGTLLKDAPLVATLAAEDLNMLREVQGSQVVRITARTRESDGVFTPTDVLLAEAVEVLQPYALELTGHATLVGSSNDCLLLNLTDGRRVELTGVQALLLHQNHGVGRDFLIRGADLGMTTASCSGGPVLMVLEYEAL
jgi:hypothetical protein